MRFTTATLAILLQCGAAFCAQQTLRTPDQIKRLSRENLQQQPPVSIRGVVTQIIPERPGLSVQAGAVGIYVSARGPLPPDVRIGSVVEIEGRADIGDFAPLVVADVIRVAAAASLPAAPQASWEAIAKGACDNTLVGVEGVVRSVSQIRPPAWEWPATVLRLDIGSNFVRTLLRDADKLPRESLVDARVRVSGVCVVFSNSRRQAQGVALAIPGPEQIRILHPGSKEPFAAPSQPIGRIVEFSLGEASLHRVKVAGVVTFQNPGGIFLQGDGEGLFVRTSSDPAIRPGDRVEAVGFPETRVYYTELADAIVRVTGHGEAPAPRSIRADAVLDQLAGGAAARSAILVRLEGRVLEQPRNRRPGVLVLQDGETTFSARLTGPAANLVESIKPGSRAAVTGICQMRVDEQGLPRTFEVRMRTPADAVLLAGPPLLSRTLALRVAEGLAVVLVVAAVWLALLRRRVAVQTETIRKQYEHQASLEKRYADLVENASDVVYVRDFEGRILQANRGAEDLTGRSRRELLGMNVVDLLAPADRSRARTLLASRREMPGSAASQEWRILTKNGVEVTIETNERFLRDGDGQARVEGIGRDITKRKQAEVQAHADRVHLEEQLRHSQRLESVGQLAGGVAHDFNNLLTVISGYSQMAMDGLPRDHRVRESIAEIAQAADRAALLTNQLLLFSRREMSSPRPVLVDQLVANLEKMLRRLIREDIELVLALEAPDAATLADPGRLDQVIVNLVVNARDAMPQGGRLLIETRETRIDGLEADLPAGDYIALTVSDSGVGMPPEVQARAFEPFFTTKDQGKGTGLGLSVVYGIVKQSGGGISVHSAPGSGTSFRILLPKTRAAQKTAAPSPQVQEAAEAGGTILVAEDEAGVRGFICTVLRSQGYRVLEAGNGREALTTAEAHSGTIDLLLTDMVMPEMSGSELASRFAELRPGAPVLKMSGYADRVEARHDPLSFIDKPFTPAALLQRIHDLMSAARTAGRAPRLSTSSPQDHESTQQ